MKNLLPVVVATVCALGLNASAQCTKDIECKGERICVKGACAEPTGTAPAETTKKPAPEATLEGVFLSVDTGDYAHWNMRVAGKDRSFFVLRPDASVQKVLQDPKKFIGKKCRIQWRKSVQNLPEAGEDIELEEVLSVKWVEK